MRTILDLRDRILAFLEGMTQRPMMYGSGPGLEVLLSHTISQLCFIDEREHEMEALMDDLKKLAAHLHSRSPWRTRSPPTRSQRAE